MPQTVDVALNEDGMRVLVPDRLFLSLGIHAIEKGMPDRTVKDRQGPAGSRVPDKFDDLQGQHSAGSPLRFFESC